MKLKRSQEKRITQEARIIRHMRYAKKISLKQAGRLVHISSSAIAHIEQGRMDLSKTRIRTLVEAYGYTMGDYMEFLDGKELPIHHRDECIRLLNEVNDVQLRTVYAVLTGFVSTQTR